MSASADYAVFGLGLASEIPLPELHAPGHGREADVHIVRGATPRFPDEAIGLTVHGEGALLVIAGAGRYWMEAGARMTVEPEAGAPDASVRLFLLGSAMAAILHQRALLPIHANGVVLEGRAVCFIGHAGAGKSTLATWFHDRGLPLLADDVCVVTEHPDGSHRVHPGIPRLRLTETALEASGRRRRDHAAAFDGYDKYNVGATGLAGGPVPLSHFYLLEGAAAGAPVSIRRLQGVEAVDALVANTYRGAYLRLMGRATDHFAKCAALARVVPVFAAARPWDLHGLDDTGAQLERHAREVLADH